jgi:hypothetical protein
MKKDNRWKSRAAGLGAPWRGLAELAAGLLVVSCLGWGGTWLQLRSFGVPWMMVEQHGRAYLNQAQRARVAELLTQSERLTAGIGGLSMALLVCLARHKKRLTVELQAPERLVVAAEGEAESPRQGLQPERPRQKEAEEEPVVIPMWSGPYFRPQGA